MWIASSFIIYALYEGHEHSNMIDDDILPRRYG